MNRPTLIDVARGAGVSRATAARVLAGSDSVDAEMTKAVLAEAARIGYETNVAARSLRSGRSGSIGLVLAMNELDNLVGTFVAAILKGATDELVGGQVQPVLLPADGSHADRIAQYVKAGHVDGAIVILQHEISEVAARLSDSSIPLVWVGRPVSPASPGTAVVDSDNYGGGRMAARALIDRGRSRIAIIRGPGDMQAAEGRLAGWRDEVSAAGLDSSLIAEGDFTVDGGTTAMHELMTRAPELDAVFASSDLMASGALRVLQAAGRRVPHDVSLVGFDDTFVAASTEPPLSSVRQPFEEMGRAAARSMLAMVDGQPHDRLIVLPTSLTNRQSI